MIFLVNATPHLFSHSRQGPTTQQRFTQQWQIETYQINDGVAIFPTFKLYSTRSPTWDCTYSNVSPPKPNPPVETVWGAAERVVKQVRIRRQDWCVGACGAKLSHEQAQNLQTDCRPLDLRKCPSQCKTEHQCWYKWVPTLDQIDISAISDAKNSKSDIVVDAVQRGEQCCVSKKWKWYLW